MDDDDSKSAPQMQVANLSFHDSSSSSVQVHAHPSHTTNGVAEDVLFQDAPDESILEQERMAQINSSPPPLVSTHDSSKKHDQGFIASVDEEDQEAVEFKDSSPTMEGEAMAAASGGFPGDIGTTTLGGHETGGNPFLTLQESNKEQSQIGNPFLQESGEKQLQVENPFLPPQESSKEQPQVENPFLLPLESSQGQLQVKNTNHPPQQSNKDHQQAGNSCLAPQEKSIQDQPQAENACLPPQDSSSEQPRGENPSLQPQERIKEQPQVKNARLPPEGSSQEQLQVENPCHPPQESSNDQPQAETSYLPPQESSKEQPQVENSSLPPQESSKEQPQPKNTSQESGGETGGSNERPLKAENLILDRISFFRRKLSLSSVDFDSVNWYGFGSPKISSPSRVAKNVGQGRGHVDTAAPFESVKEAVNKFGGIVDWKAHKEQKVERRKLVEEELEKAQQEVPESRRLFEIAEQEKARVLRDLDSTKRLIEELKLNLERAETEESQAKQDSELVKLRVEEMEQGVSDDASVAAKAQLEVAKERQLSAISELKSVNKELEALRKEYASLVEEKGIAVMRAEEAVSAAKNVEKTVEELTIELIATKDSLESAQAASLEAEELRIDAAVTREKDCVAWEKELKETEDEFQRLNQQDELAKDLKSKFDTATAFLANLKAELSAYMSSDGDSGGGSGTEDSEKKNRKDLQASVASAKKELAEVRLNVEKATAEVNSLKVSAASLRSELEEEKSALEAAKQREGEGSAAITNLKADLEQIGAEIKLFQAKEMESRETMGELPKQLQEVAMEADRAKLEAQLAREELHKAKEEVEEANAAVFRFKSRLVAARKEIEAATASEKLALGAIKALRESESAQATPDDTDSGSSSSVTLSLEEYYELSKRAHDAEEQANSRVEAAISKINSAKELELKSLESLEEANRGLAERKEVLKQALEKAGRAMEGKLGVEQELRKWRSENEQRRKTGDPSSSSQEPWSSIDDTASKASTLSFSSASPSRLLSNSGSSDSGDVKVAKKKKRSLFPRIFLFLGRRKSKASS